VGAKLVGLLRLRAHRARLCAMVTDREPAPFSRRLLGADFREPGFVRRNAVEALGRLSDPDGKTQEALLAALKDPYWEVSAAAAGALADLAPLLDETTRAAALRVLPEVTQSRRFETAAAAVRAIGSVARDDAVLPVLKRLHYHANWHVRSAVVCAYEDLHKRGVVADAGRLRALLDDVLMTCDSFTPFFRLKEDLGRARAKFQGGSAAAGGST
jgi:UDP-N-acetylglucosamine--N-acetylmuramyl-(pentapeptide) pyrophosphoryl-undecaprenol N-acetylglucosamine transferase